MLLGKTVHGLPGKVRPHDLPLELKAVPTMTTHGPSPQKARRSWGEICLASCPAAGVHSTVAAILATAVAPTGSGSKRKLLIPMCSWPYAARRNGHTNGLPALPEKPHLPVIPLPPGPASRCTTTAPDTWADAR